MASLSADERRASVLNEAVLRYEGYLPLVEDWLLEKYGITPETAQRFRLGCAEDPYPAHMPMHGRAVLPYRYADGRIASLKFRCCVPGCDCKEAGHPKYLGEQAAVPLLFNTADLLDDEATTLYVVEGEFDAIVLSQIGLTVVGYPGTGSWSSVFTRAIGPQDWERIVVLADGDDAGRAAAKKVAKELRGDVVNLPDGEDVSSLYVKDPGRLRSLLGLDQADTGDDPELELPPL